jgi:hypothetical protein
VRIQLFSVFSVRRLLVNRAPSLPSSARPDVAIHFHSKIVPFEDLVLPGFLLVRGGTVRAGREEFVPRGLPGARDGLPFAYRLRSSPRTTQAAGEANPVEDIAIRRQQGQQNVLQNFRRQFGQTPGTIEQIAEPVPVGTGFVVNRLLEGGYVFDQNADRLR